MSDNRDHGDETGADAYDESEPQGVSGAAGCDIYGYPVHRLAYGYSVNGSGEVQPLNVCTLDDRPHDWRDDKIAQQAWTIAALDVEIAALKRQIGAAVADAIPLTEDERKQRDYAAIRRQRMPERY